MAGRSAALCLAAGATVITAADNSSPFLLADHSGKGNRHDTLAGMSSWHEIVGLGLLARPLPAGLLTWRTWRVTHGAPFQAFRRPDRR